MDDDDLDFGDDFGDDSKKKPTSTARQGRRAARAAPPPGPDPSVEADDEEALPAANSTPSRGKSARDPDGPPRPRRQMGGWGESKNADSMDELEDERLRPQTAGSGGEDGDSDPDIPVIPDLDDQQDDDYMTSTVAVAPSVAINRVATYRELDNDLLSHAQFLTLDNEIDLKLLAKCLSAEGDVVEADKPWDWDRLFTEVTSELLTEWEKKEEKEEDENNAADMGAAA